MVALSPFALAVLMSASWPTQVAFATLTEAAPLHQTRTDAAHDTRTPSIGELSPTRGDSWRSPISDPKILHTVPDAGWLDFDAHSRRPRSPIPSFWLSQSPIGPSPGIPAISARLLRSDAPPRRGAAVTSSRAEVARSATNSPLPSPSPPRREPVP